MRRYTTKGEGVIIFLPMAAIPSLENYCSIASALSDTVTCLHDTGPTQKPTISSGSTLASNTTCTTC